MSTADLTPLEVGGAPLTATQLVEALGLWEAQPVGDRPRVVAAMIGAADGRATIDGRAGGLGSPADRAVLRALRAPADVLLVGPGTLIAEGYATLLDDEHRQLREDRGRSPQPELATISRSLDPRLADVPVLAERGTVARIFTEADGELINAFCKRLERKWAENERDREQPATPDVAEHDVVFDSFERGTLNAAACLEGLHRVADAKLVVTEGGPTLLRELVAGRLVDDLVLTVAPYLVAGEGRSILHGPVLDPPARMELRAVLRGEDHLFLHYALGSA